MLSCIGQAWYGARYVMSFLLFLLLLSSICMSVCLSASRILFSINGQKISMLFLTKHSSIPHCKIITITFTLFTEGKVIHFTVWAFFFRFSLFYFFTLLNRFPISPEKLIICFLIFIHHTLSSKNWISSLLPSPYFLAQSSLLWVKYWNTNVIKVLKWQMEL